MITNIVGEFISEEIKNLNMTPDDLASKLNIETEIAYGMITGAHRITLEISEKLSKFFGTNVKFWLDLQKTDDKKKSLHRMKESMFK